MIRIVFKDLEKSELAKDIAFERLQSVVERFPDLQQSRITVTLSMENSPHQAGPDLFKVKVICRGGRYDGVILEKSGPTLYAALAEVVEYILERLNRFGDKARTMRRKLAQQHSLVQQG